MTEEFVPTMATTVVDKRVLIEVLRENRKLHLADYQEARQGYKEAVTAALTKALKAAKAGDYEAWRNMYHNLSKPENYEKSYDLAIKKMELSQHSIVHLSDAEFKQYVMDEWAWTNQFTTSTAMYVSK